MTISTQHNKPTVKDVARQAGVSLATVDRVLNGRAGVRKSTREKVEKAVAALNYSRDVGASLLARAKTIKIHFLLPGGDNPFMANLAAAIRSCSRSDRENRTSIDVTRVEAFNSPALCKAISRLGPENCDCAIVVATDDEDVRKSIDRASLKGMHVITLVSDSPASRRSCFVGIDNVAAGRTAGSLMGRFCASGARIGLIVGSMGLRDHRERFIGFHDLVLEEFPGLELVGPVEGFDDAHETAKRTQELLADYPDLAGLYSMGAGTAGVVSALTNAGRTRSTRLIVHELTRDSVEGLRAGIVDVVLDQNPLMEVKAAIELARKLVAGAELSSKDRPIDIGVFVRDNLNLPDGKQSSGNLL